MLLEIEWVNCENNIILRLKFVCNINFCCVLFSWLGGVRYDLYSLLGEIFVWVYFYLIFELWIFLCVESDMEIYFIGGLFFFDVERNLVFILNFFLVKW